MERITLFCFPYAGGSAASYAKWYSLFPENIKIVPVEISGRGCRMNDPLLYRISDVVDDAYSQIKNDIKNTNYAIFGHSMGSIVAFEIANKIFDLNESGIPKHVFFSGRNAPFIRSKNIIYDLPEDEFRNEILNIGGTSELIFKEKSLRSVFLPILRADFEAIDTYECKNFKKLNTNISVFYSKEDKLCYKEGIEGWKTLTEKSCKFYDFKGDHFFIDRQINSVVSTIVDILNKEG